MEEEIEVRISIPKLLYKKLIKMSKYMGFTNIEEFIIFVLEQLIETCDFEEDVKNKAN